jgi:hypothetical protein
MPVCSSPSLFFSDAIKYTGLLCYLLPPHVLCYYRPKAIKPSNHERKLFAIRLPFLLLSIIPGISHSNRKVTSTEELV